MVGPVLVRHYRSSAPDNLAVFGVPIAEVGLRTGSYTARYLDYPFTTVADPRARFPLARQPTLVACGDPPAGLYPASTALRNGRSARYRPAVCR